MALILHDTMTPTPQDGRFLQQLALSDVAGEIAKLLREAYEIAGGQKPDFIEARRIRATADRMVALQAPSKRETALAAANDALARTLSLIREETQRNYCDHSSALLVSDALDTMQGMTQRIGAGYILSAFDGALEAGR